MSRFSSYVTSKFFSIDLSEPMIKTLNYLYNPDVLSHETLRLIPTDSRTYISLYNRGLIDLTDDGKAVITKPGKILCQLLVEAELFLRPGKELIGKKFTSGINKQIKADSKKSEGEK